MKAMTAKRPRGKRIAIVFAMEYSYAREVLRGIIAATRARGVYRTDSNTSMSASPASPWTFRIFRGRDATNPGRLAQVLRDWNPDGIIAEVFNDRLMATYRATGKPVVELFANRRGTDGTRVVDDDVAVGRMAARYFVERGFRNFANFGNRAKIWSRETRKGLSR